MTTLTVGEALLRALKEHGAREVFGIPGDFALPFFKVIEDSGILPLYTLSHEPAVGFAADAAARANCGLGVAVVTYGAGALNMLNAVACAYAERSPVVVVSGAPSKRERLGGLWLHHQTRTLDSQYRLFEEITCDQIRLDEAERAPDRIARVLRSCVEHSQPVYIELPRDIVGAACAPVPRLAPSPATPDAVAECAAEILERLEHARSPVIMVDIEVRRYGVERQVAEFARRLGLPVVTSFMGQGLLADTGRPPLGAYLGAAGTPDITDLVEGSDALLLLGVIPSDTNLGASKAKLDLHRTMHALGRQVHIGHHVYPNVPLDALVGALLARTAGGTPRAAAHTRAPCPSDTGFIADGAPIAPSDIARAVNDLMRRNGPIPIASDIGDCLFLALEIEPTALVAPGYYATMGFGVPAGLGLEATTGIRPLILVGDGAFQMTGSELGNCQRYGWSPIVIVLNNAGWEMLRAFQPESRFNDLGAWRYADIATALGGDGRRVSTRAEFRDALDRACAATDRFHLIEVMLPPGSRSETLSRFVAKMKRPSPP